MACAECGGQRWHARNCPALARKGRAVVSVLAVLLTVEVAFVGLVLRRLSVPLVVAWVVALVGVALLRRRA